MITRALYREIRQYLKQKNVAILGPIATDYWHFFSLKNHIEIDAVVAVLGNANTTALARTKGDSEMTIVRKCNAYLGFLTSAKDGE